jgi:hypothetical protein
MLPAFASTSSFGALMGRVAQLPKGQQSSQHGSEAIAPAAHSTVLASNMRTAETPPHASGG